MEPIQEEGKENLNLTSGKSNTNGLNSNHAAQDTEIEEMTKNLKRVSIKNSDPSQKFGKFNMKLLKAKWRSKFLKARKRHKEGKAMTPHHSVANFDKIIQPKVRNCEWKVLQTVDQGNGKLLQHVIIQNEFMQQIQISKQRRIFVNFFRDQKNDKWRLCKKRLPRDKTAWHLYQLDFNESVFQKELSGFDLFLTNPEVEGVYETQVDLDFALFRDFGVRCSVYKNARDQLIYDKVSREFRLPAEALKNHQNWAHGDSKSLTVFGKVPLLTKKLRHCVLWGVAAKDKCAAFVWGPKQAIFLLCGKRSAKIKKQALVDFKNYVQNLVRSQIQTVFEHQSADDSANYRVEVKSSTDQAQFTKDLHSALEIFLPSAQMHSPSPSLLTSCTNLNFQALVSTRSLRSLFKIPILDLTYSEHLTLNSLTWRKTLAAIGAQHLPKINNLLTTLDRLASFSQIPLANLGNNLASSLVTCMDTLFARRLKSMNYLSWYSCQRLPDLGLRGLVQAESAFLLEMSDEEDEVMDQRLNSRRVIRPGTYDGFVVELKLEMFVMNALINASNFEENEFLEKEMLKSKHIHKFLNPSLRFGGTEIQNNAAFKIVKELLVKWYKKIRLDEDPSADLLTTNIMSWMTSPESKFFDPAVRRRFLRVVRKAFDSLLVKLEDLGAGIVMADYQNILIQTSRNDHETASSFREYVLANLREDARFEYVGFEPGKTYAMLVLYDQYNYLGVVIDNNAAQAKQPEPIQEEGAVSEQTNGNPTQNTGQNNSLQENDPETQKTQANTEQTQPSPRNPKDNITYGMDSQLNMHSLLPPEMQSIMLGLLEYFLNESFNLLLKTRQNNAEKTLKNVKSVFEVSLEDFVKNNFSQNLFESIDYMKEQLRLHEVSKLEMEMAANFKNSKSQSAWKSGKGNEDHINNTRFEEPRVESDYENDSFLEDPEEEFADLLEQERLEGKINLLQNREEQEEDQNNEPRQPTAHPWEVCQVVGQMRDLGDPILEFINLIFEILTAGDISSRQCLGVLKENVMIYLRQDAYGEIAKFKPLIGSFALHDVKCFQCRHVSSIDIFRDYLAQGAAQQGNEARVPYNCQCGAFFEKSVIENKILEKLEQKLKSCLGHDLYCVKCLGIRCGLFVDRCQCAGKYVFREGHFIKLFKGQLVTGLASFKRLAHALDMPRLRRFLESLVY